MFFHLTFTEPGFSSLARRSPTHVSVCLLLKQGSWGQPFNECLICFFVNLQRIVKVFELANRANHTMIRTGSRAAANRSSLDQDQVQNRTEQIKIKSHEEQDRSS